MLEQIPLRALLWGLFGVALLIAWIILGLDGLSGLVPVMFGMAFLIVFRPPKVQLTEADLDALLGRA